MVAPGEIGDATAEHVVAGDLDEATDVGGTTTYRQCARAADRGFGGEIVNAADNSDTPLVLMGYFNPIHHYGVPRFIEEAKAAGVDGLIVVDLPPEQNEDLCDPAQDAAQGW